MYVVVNESFLQHASFCHVCKRNLYIISVEAEMAKNKSFVPCHLIGSIKQTVMTLVHSELK